MSIPNATEQFRDFGLNFSTPASMRPVVFGTTSLGVTNKLAFYSDVQTLKDERGEGPAVETVANILANGGGPVGLVSADPTIAAVVGPMYATFGAVGSNGSITRVGAVGPAITVSGAPNGHFAMKIEVTLGGTLGVSQFRWSLDGGTTWVATAVPTAASVLLGGTGITATFPAGTYVLAETYAWTATGGGGKIVASGTPALDVRIRVEMMLGGALGVAKFRYSLDGYSGDTTSERTYSETLTVPSGGVFAIPNLGVTLTFTASPTFAAGDVYVCTVQAATWNATDLDDCFAELLKRQDDWRFLVAVTSAGNGDTVALALLGAALNSQLSAFATRNRYRRGMIAADQGHTAAEALSSWGSVVAPRILAAFGQVRRATSKPFPGYAFPVTHGIDCVAARAAGSLPSTDLKRVRSGPLTEVVKLFADEQASPTGLDDIKVTTLRTFDGRPGEVYVTQGRLKSASGSDLKGWQYGVLTDIACEAVHRVVVKWIGKGFGFNDDGTLDESDAVDFDADVDVELDAVLGSATNAEGKRGHVQSVKYRVSRTEKSGRTGAIVGSLSMKPFNYVDSVRSDVGFVVANPTPVA